MTPDEIHERRAALKEQRAEITRGWERLDDLVLNVAIIFMTGVLILVILAGLYLLIELL